MITKTVSVINFLFLIEILDTIKNFTIKNYLITVLYATQATDSPVVAFYIFM
jgi:hypothetical protein